MPKALFLDRDGVVNVDKGFVHTREAFEFIPGIFELCAKAHAMGYGLIICTNQSGIGRGLFSQAQFDSLTEWMTAEFAARQAPLAAVYHCPYHPEEGKGAYRLASPDRKPQPGMFLKARERFGLDMAASLAIGDTPRDAQAALAAGVGTVLNLGQDVPGAVNIPTLAAAGAYLKA